MMKTRYRLLLAAALLVIILPAFHSYVPLPELLLVVSMSFLFIQGMLVAKFDKSISKWPRYAILIMLLAILWIEPAGFSHKSIGIVKLLSQALFFGFVIYLLIRFVTKSIEINSNVIVVVVIIYLIMGIIAGNLSFLLFLTLPDSFAFPEWISQPSYVDFLYFGFIAMSTTGFGDITPICNEAKTFTYLLAITGQLYIAIVIAMIVGKYLTSKKTPDIQ